jgi:hypothetical protein
MTTDNRTQRGANEAAIQQLDRQWRALRATVSAATPLACETLALQAVRLAAADVASMSITNPYYRDAIGLLETWIGRTSMSCRT